MKRPFMVALTSAILATMVLAGGAAAASETIPLVFEDRYQVFKFELQIDHGTRVKADTRDCCVEDDEWGVTLVRPHDFGQSEPISRTACGDGSTDDFSGKVVMPARHGIVIAYVYVCGITGERPGDYPAGMDVRFRFDGNMTVVPKA